MDITTKVTHMLEPSLKAMGYELVLLKLSEHARRRTLSLMAERADGQAMSFDDCSEITRMVSALLDVEDPITGAYDLEVCSPGLDRPLTRPEHFARFAGHEAKVETMLPVDGRKRFRGVVNPGKNDTVTVTLPEGAEVNIPFANIKMARLVAADALVAQAMKKAK